MFVYNNTEVATCLHKRFMVGKIVACKVANSTLYLTHSLGGSAKNDRTINKLGFSQSQVVAIDQSDASLQSLPSNRWG